MKNIFDYDNKIMQTLSVLGDLILLNILFLLCCLPVFTIGAAQAALCTALRQLTNKEDDSSCFAAFFKGLTSGFATITGGYCVMLALILVSGYSVISIIFYASSGVSGAPVIISIAALLLGISVQTLMSVFHSRFNCTFHQLLKNSWLMFIAQFPRALLCGLLAWLPVLILLVSVKAFVLLTPVILLIGYTLLFLLINLLFQKPFARLICQMQKKAAEAAPEDLPEASAE